ncbi:hypothetical protein BurJ1DRAFT_0166 [Burkholderiales bacterium JOSHI_001]|nr:hypothetical protein BurJ1DRAFT_0166 [Burkholderiales bacterium JOSHI_001]
MADGSAKRMIRNGLRYALGALAAVLAGPGLAAPPVVGILQGNAVLVRQTTRWQLAEGAMLAEGDIIETAAGGFVQIEFDDGALLGLGESAKLLLQPRLGKGGGVPRAYVMEGFAKARPADDPKAAALALLSPRLELEASGGAVVAQFNAKAVSVFTERGNARLATRDAARSTLTAKAGDFASLPAGGKLAIAPRMSPEFLEQLPKPFRDALPARAALLVNKRPTLKALGPIDYAGVQPWLTAEPLVRLPLARQWRGMAADRAFRGELAAHLSAHPEWERVLYPERFLPKPRRPMPPRAPASAAPVAAPAASAATP